MGKEKPAFARWPVWGEAELEAVRHVVESGQWWCGAPEDRAGDQVWAFQDEFAAFQEARHCIAVSNGTVALEAVLAAFGVGLGDEVIISDYTFFATASSVLATGAVPVFCDIDPETLVMDVDRVSDLITSRTRAVIAVHLGGNPVEMDRLCTLAAEHGLKVLEDCAHAHGSRYRGKRVGTWGDAGTFSFQASKVLTAGEGGAIICNDGELADRIYSITDCGRKRGDYFYAHHEYGSNFRMPELSAALLRVQLGKFPEQHGLRNDNARYLADRLNGITGISVMKPTPGTDEIGYYLFPFLFEHDRFEGIGKEGFVKKLHEAGIPTDDCYPPLHTLSCFIEGRLRNGIDYGGFVWGEDKDFPVVSDVFGRSVQLPHQVLLSVRKQLDYIADTVEGLA
jgi:dTDP-4-amino-4,6-dideoxygalactose transaminase